MTPELETDERGTHLTPTNERKAKSETDREDDLGETMKVDCFVGS